MRAASRAALPVLTVAAALVAAWYLLAVALNWQVAADARARAGQPADAAAKLAATMAQARPLLPAPHQVAEEVWRTTAEVPVTSRRTLLYHAWVTLSAALAGLGIGMLAGALAAAAMVQVRALRRGLMPWIIASQAVPVLALAPIVVVALGSLGLTGLLPKAIVAAYLCFAPVAIATAKGLEAPDTLSRDLMRTYSATGAQTFWKLRVPASLPFLFAGMKIAAAAAVVGAIVAELPTGAQAGLGARLLAGSYFGQTVQIWAALVAASLLSGTLVALVGLAQRLSLRHGGTA